MNINYLSVVTPSKLYYQSQVFGKELTRDFVRRMRRNPPSFLGFDGKAMKTNQYEEDDEGTRHPKTIKIDQIGKLPEFSLLTVPGSPG